MGTDVELELKDFIRWLATMPHHFAEFKRDPEQVMRNAKLSEMAVGTLRGLGKAQVVEQIVQKKEEILTSPEALKGVTFARDFSAGGYGGTVLKKGPADGAGD